MAAFADIKNYQNQISLLKPKNEYHRAELPQQKRKSSQWQQVWRKKLFWFQNFYYIKKAVIVSNFCLIGKIPHDFPILRSIESAWKTFMDIQVKISVQSNQIVDFILFRTSVIPMWVVHQYITHILQCELKQSGHSLFPLLYLSLPVRLVHSQLGVLI